MRSICVQYHDHSLNNAINITHNNFEVRTLDKKTEKQNQEQQNLNKFNSITQKDTPENQNQTHNSRKEGIQPINQKR